MMTQLEAFVASRELTRCHAAHEVPTLGLILGRLRRAKSEAGRGSGHVTAAPSGRAPLYTTFTFLLLCFSSHTYRPTDDRGTTGTNKRDSNIDPYQVHA